MRIQAYTDRHPSLSLIARCPRCATPDLRIRRSLDYCDPLYQNPFSLLQRYLGGSLMYCVDCRLQFYDLRPHRGKQRR